MSLREWPTQPSSLPEDCQYVELFGGALRCWQPRRGYRFSVDALLLAMAASRCPGETVLELGTGVGVVLLVLSYEERFSRLVGIELQPSLAAFARENVRLNRLGGRLSIVEGDLRAPPRGVEGIRFDLVVSNPPYYPVPEGHVNPDPQKAIARHEVTCRLADILARIGSTLAADGTAVLVYPASRADTVIETAGEASLAVVEVLPIRSRASYAARRALLWLRRAPGGDAAAPSPPVVHPPMDIHDTDGTCAGRLAAFFGRLERSAAAGRSR